MNPLRTAYNALKSKLTQIAHEPAEFRLDNPVETRIRVFTTFAPFQGRTVITSEMRYREILYDSATLKIVAVSTATSPTRDRAVKLRIRK